MNKEIIIRNYIYSDKKELLQILSLNIPKYFAEEEIGDFEIYLEKYIEDFFVIEHNKMLIGCGGINYKNDKSMGVISWDIIKPEYQGKSIGKKLLEYRLELIHSQKSINKIIVRTSKQAYKFYEKCGFKLLEIKENYWAEGFDLYYMVFNN